MIVTCMGTWYGGGGGEIVYTDLKKRGGGTCNVARFGLYLDQICLT